MNKTITATWKPERSPETKVTFQAGYRSLSRVEKLDFLQDTISDLTESYNQELDKFGPKPQKEGASA